MSTNREHPSSPYRSPKLFLLLFRLELLMIVACLSGGGLAAAGVMNDTVSPWIFAASAAVAEGFLMGSLARLFFKRFSRLLQWVSGIAGTTTGLIILGWLSRGLAGADPNGVMQYRTDWVALVQILIGGVSATLAFSAGRIRYPEPIPETGGEGEPSPNGAAAPSARRIKTNRPIKKIRPARERIRGMLRLFRKGNHDAEVRLLGSEEHRCPYCLQLITPRDPRGVVTCPVCHTRHHKDCWEITGMCQVPHFHS